MTAITKAHALPIDWHGVFGVDSTLINNFRKIDRKSSGITNQGSQEVALGAGDHSTASIQTYVLQLNPTIIINDSVSFKSEITTGYGRGGRVGENTTQSKSGSFGNALYYYNTSDSQNDLVINKAYMELYADTATYLIGRHSDHWGLGALWNEGSNTWDRHTFIRDGLTVKIKIGNFKLSPYIARSGADQTHTRATRTKEIGASLLYDNTEREMALGLLYGKKETGAFSSAIQADVTADSTNNPSSLGKADIKIIDIYFKKAFGPFSFSIEIPLLSGDIGHLYAANQDASYSAKAFVTESVFHLSPSWKLGLNAGKVSGHGGSQASFDAMYLNPNYQVANIMFRYNMAAVGDNTQNLWDSYITNATYAKVFAEYSTDKWKLNGAFIWAIAEESADAGKSSFNHTNNKIFTATTTQSDDYGQEVDVNFDYYWNKETLFGAAFGYHFVGDYFKYTNDSAVVNNTKNTLLLGLKAAITF